MLGEYDRQVVVPHPTTRRARGLLSGTAGSRARARPYSTQRTRVLSPGEIANIPAGRALHLDGVRWELVTLTPAHTTRAMAHAHRTLRRLSTAGRS